MTSDRFDRDNSTLMNGQHIQNIIINSNSNSSNTTAEFHEKLNTEHHPIITTHHTTADDDDDLDYDDAHSITPMHWLVLTLACLLLFGNYYCYDIPGALNVQLRQWLGHDYDQWQLEMNSLYTAYSAPNLLMPIVGGILVDTMGPTKMLLSFSVLVVVGQSLFSLGVSLRYYWLMLLGRFLFGIGGESLEVAQSQITTSWFMQRSLGLALGLNLTCARLATALNDILSPMINAASNPAVTSWFGVLTCVLSLLCSLGLGALNRRSIRRQYGMDQYEPLPIDGEGGADEECSVCDADRLPVDEKLGSDSVLKDSGDAAETIRWTDVRNLPAAFWILCLATIALYGAVNPFIHVLSDFLQQKWYKNDPETAGAVMAIPDIISAIGSPLCGWLLDRVARNAAKKSSAFSSAAQQQRPVRAFFLPLSGLFLVIVHTLLGFTNISPIFALFILGLAYSLFGAALWPMIPHLVANNRLLGTAYGVSTVALNIALTFVPLIVAKILNAGSYVSVEIWFIILSSLGLALSIMVGIFDQRRYSSRYGSMPNDDADDDDVPTALDDNQFQSEDEEVDGNEYKPLLVHTKAAPSYAHLYDEDGNGEFDEGVLKDDDFETELVGDHHIVTIPKRPHIPSHPHSRHNHHHHHRPSDNK